MARIISVFSLEYLLLARNVSTKLCVIVIIKFFLTKCFIVKIKEKTNEIRNKTIVFILISFFISYLNVLLEMKQCCRKFYCHIKPEKKSFSVFKIQIYIVGKSHLIK